MRLLNKTKHSTTGLRIMLYDLAQVANISTRGITVEVRRASRNLHGLCYPDRKGIILWLLNTSNTDDISHIWLHELAHTTRRNRKLYAAGHGQKGQKQADMVAERVTGITRDAVTWHSQEWRLEPPGFSYQTKAEALKALTRRRNPFGKPDSRNMYRLWPKSRRGNWRIERKTKKLNLNRIHPPSIERLRKGEK